MKSTEELLARVMNRFAEEFKGKLILKGGMLLRLYNSPRSTQDIDFVLLTKESKKVWKEHFLKSLKAIEDLKVTNVELNSRGIFIDIEDTAGDLKAMIEINVLPPDSLDSEPLSTALLSQKYSMSGRVISAMTIPEAFSHKIAAALERDALRDLYDLSQMEAMGSFDQKALKERLSKLSINREKPKSVSASEAAKLLRQKLTALDLPKIEKELYPFLPPEFRPGVLGVIRASVGRIVQRLENSDS